MFSLSGRSVTSVHEIEEIRRERKAKREQKKEEEEKSKGDCDSPRTTEEKDIPSKRKERDRPSRRKTSSGSKEKDRSEKRSSPRRQRRPPSSLSSEASSAHRTMSGVVPEMDRRPSGSLASSGVGSYPKFSPKHSKEAVGSRDNIVNPRLSLYTPDPTDLGSAKHIPERRYPSAGTGAAPPSPPLTMTEPELRRSRSSNSVKKTPSQTRIASPPRKISLERGIHEKNNPRRTSSSSSLRKRADSEPRAVRSGLRNASPGNRSKEELIATGTDISSSSYDASQNPGTQSTAARSTATSTATESTVEPVPRKMPPPPSRQSTMTVPHAQSSPLSAPDSSPRTPTTNEAQFAPTSNPMGKAQVIEVVPEAALPSPYSAQSSFVQTPVSAGLSSFPPPPPPPPPPPALNQHIETPRVDYLLQNGGLPHLVPKRFTSVLAPTAPQQSQYSNFISPRAFGPQHTDVRNIFLPLQSVLDSYLQVIHKNGSIAVATGYKSVARRLLDRLEAVFNRNISSETCECIMCANDENKDIMSEDEGTGISWGEILEFVSGRQELPTWPPFEIAHDVPVYEMGTEAPMQKMDIDVPPEFRDHYIKQSKRTKDAVQRWLAAQPETRCSPPQEIDDETLMFAMITHLEPENRKLFTALLRGMSTLPVSRAPTPAETPKSELMKRTALSLQRLYRLEKPPRDAECAIFLLRNPHLHRVLATLAAVSAGEWEILISGRFDGFLWSGAESVDNQGPSRGPTPLYRMNTPGIPSRGPTPMSRGPSRGPVASPTASSFGAPVQMDEETEIAVLAEVEREIFMGMDALEDAFEALHIKAEEVRAALRARSTGLSVAAQRRRGSFAQGLEALSATPSVGTGVWGTSGVDEDDWLDDSRSELRPDDSASNISYGRRRRKHHRDKERRETPAPVEEEDEESDGAIKTHVKHSPKERRR
ncbi:uncharacterized protein PV09_07117 [Verruconis gallopava]|uniref:5-Methylcytosine G/T mismatch-specific DNA glycosylase n=1 Tax=Verruconis gallopava TaxID=253628 RepID=A0A0D2A4F4_9PEZI|nr:uncharacterized protein PV09_07117 [Verruconis gallopava]KIW01345.1 hypothetical protein PV09_07117 [Verruconis gallopava]